METLEIINECKFYLFLGLLGTACNILMKIIKSQEARKNFSKEIWWEKNWAKTMLSIIMTFATILMANEMGQLNETVAFGTGFGIDLVIKTWNQKTQEKLGENQNVNENKPA